MQTMDPLTELKSPRRCGLFQLPIELRWQIFEDFLSEWCSGPPEIYYFPGQVDSGHPIQMMKLNRQVYSEMTDILRSQHTLSYRITCWDADFDPLALWSFKLRKHRPTFGEIKHLVVDIHPPHPDRPIDMLHIWRRAQKLCKDLRATKQVSQISVRFKDDEIAAWSTNGVPHHTMRVMLWYKDPKNCDVGQLIHLFAHLTNVTKARIELPASLTTHKALMRWAALTEGSMMGTWKLDQEDLQEEYELLEEDITDSEWVIRNATGRKSKLKFHQTFGEDPWLSKDQYDDFISTWPHMDDLSKRERPHYNRIGDWDYYDYIYCDY